MPEDKHEIIRKILMGIYFLKSAEIDFFLKKIIDYPEEALDKVIEVLKKAEQQQTEMLDNAVKTDKIFILKLENFLKANEKLIKAQYAFQKTG